MLLSVSLSRGRRGKGGAESNNLITLLCSAGAAQLLMCSRESNEWLNIQLLPFNSTSIFQPAATQLCVPLQVLVLEYFPGKVSLDRLPSPGSVRALPRACSTHGGVEMTPGTPWDVRLHRQHKKLAAFLHTGSILPDFCLLYKLVCGGDGS